MSGIRGIRITWGQRAEATLPKLESRLTKGEKPNRKRMATVAAVYTVGPQVRTAEEVIAGLRHLRPTPQASAPPRPRPEFKRVWAMLCLRAILRSGDWDEYWRFHTRAEHWRNHVVLYDEAEPPPVKIPRQLGKLRRVK